ncbi:MAG: hypothetical protein CMJ76_13460 [Planctomycetaceae bacterium]|nr:hypothetical protein [Planctomycetaceae bacterium]
MAYYNRVKASKNVPIGTIIPWTGSSSGASSDDGLPHGYKVCNGEELQAVYYPILANILGNTFGPFPDPQNPSEVGGIGGNVGISNAGTFADPYLSTDVFRLPDFTLRNLIDIEYSRLDIDTQFIIGEYVSKNGIEGKQPITLQDTDVDITFAIAASNELSGRMTGQSITAPTYVDNIYSIPRKLGIDHTPGHMHRAATDNDYDQIDTANPTGASAGTFQPGNYQPSDATYWQEVSGVGAINNADSPESWKAGLGQAKITWNDSDHETLVQTNTAKQIDQSKNVTPQVKSRVILNAINGPVFTYTDDGSGIASIQAAADVGPIPVPGQYSGFQNYFFSDDIPASRGGGKGRPTDPNYDPDTYTTYPTTKPHNAEEWADPALGGHTHEPMTVEMTRGVRMPNTILVNNVSTNTAVPVSIPDALNISMNVNTPSLTTIFIMRVS